MPAGRTPAFAFLAVLALVLAGCAAKTSPTPVASNAAPSAVAPTFGAAVHVDDATPAAEPSIQIAPDGTVWITAPMGLLTGDAVWKSKDGLKFDHMPTPDVVFGGGDSDFAIDAGGRLYQTGLWLGCVSVSTSTDGQSWSTDPLACVQPVDDRNWLATAGKDTAYVTFGGGAVGGATPSNPVIQVLKTALVDPVPLLVQTSILPDADGYQWPGNIAVDPKDGSVYVAFLTVDHKAFVYRSTDQGASWKKLPVSERKGDTFDSFVVVAVDRAGNVYESWSERDSGTQSTDIFLAVSADKGASWKVHKVNSPAIHSAVFPWIAAGDAGRVDVVYYGTDAKGESPEKVKGTWRAYLAQSLDALADAPTFTETAISADPVKEGSICTSGTGCAAGTRGLLDYFQVAIDAKGMAHVAWTMDVKDPGVVMYARQTGGPSLLANATSVA